MSEYKKPYVISIIGSHNVGKSTLCAILSSKINDYVKLVMNKPLLVFTTSEVARRCKLMPANGLADRLAQNWIFLESLQNDLEILAYVREHLENVLDSSFCIMDRSVIDPYFYALSNLNNNLSEITQNDIDFIKHTLEIWLRDFNIYNAIFPIYTTKDAWVQFLTHDGFRNTDIIAFEHVQNICQNIMHQLSLNPRLAKLIKPGIINDGSRSLESIAIDIFDYLESDIRAYLNA